MVQQNWLSQNCQDGISTSKMITTLNEALPQLAAISLPICKVRCEVTGDGAFTESHEAPLKGTGEPLPASHRINRLVCERLGLVAAPALVQCEALKNQRSMCPTC